MNLLYFLRARKSSEARLQFDVALRSDSDFMTPQVSRLDCLSESANTKTYEPEHKSMDMEYFLTCLWILSSLVLLAFSALMAEKILEQFFQKNESLKEFSVVKGSMRNGCM